ncbi:hypothetical protein [Motilimonas eburnea]|uniref:hypothetical protein n=1 Tax=Motilimonas eburnea TaxID=1737488 RepID=UPI001E46443C|nr:hypothetical protein [Motilimonas eburnea]MCE2572922.1 hypothetical protein [Motilimonas eburnea]
MRNNPAKLIFSLLFNRSAMLSMIVPALLYILVYRYVGLSAAVLVTGFYGLGISFVLKSLGYIALAFALFGLLEVVIVTLAPAEWLVDLVYFKMLLGALQSMLIFVVFALLGKPIPRLFAEAGQPDLLAWPFSKTATYRRIWQQASAIWVLGYATKALVLWLLYPMSEATVATLNVALGWPIHASLLVLSVLFVHHQFARANVKVANHSPSQ